MDAATRCPECDALMDLRQRGTFNAHWECPFDGQLVWQVVGD